MQRKNHKYAQIKEHIIRGIAAGAFEGQLPSENELAQRFAVSRMTARRALSELEREGYVRRVPGKGTFLERRQLTEGFFRVRPFRDYAREHGLVARTKVLELAMVEPPPAVAARLGPGQCVLVRRLHYLNDQPVRFETRYLRADLCGGILWKNLEAESINDILINQFNLPLTRVWQRLQAVGLPPTISRHFQLDPGEPAFRIERVTYTFEEAVTRVEYYLRGDLYAFEDTFCPHQAESSP